MPRQASTVKRDFRAGHIPELATFRPDEMPINSIFDCQDVNLRDGSVEKRGGEARFNIHAVGSLLISTLEEAGWTNGTTDFVLFKEGSGSLKNIILNSGGQSITTDLAGTFNMGGATGTDTIDFWMNTDGAIGTTNFLGHHLGDIDLTFYEVVTGKRFEFTVSHTTFVNGWQVISIPKSSFTAIGAPSWASIIQLTITVRRDKAVAPNGSSDITVWIDDLAVNPHVKILNIIDYIQQDGTQFILAYGGTKIYRSITNQTDWSELVTGLTNGKRLGWIVFNDHLIYGNGTDANAKYKAAKTNFGFGAPPAAATFNANTNGTMTVGNYFYKFVYFNSGTSHKGNPSPNPAVMATLADPNDGIIINIPADGAVDTQVDEVIVYRTLVNAPVNSDYFRISGTHAYTGSAITVTDTKPDAELLAERLQFDNDIPPKFTMVVTDSVYIYYAGDPANPSRVWRSKALDPESVPVLSFTDVRKNDGDVIRALGITEHKQVVAFKQNSKFRILNIPGGLISNRFINNRGTFNTETIRQIPIGLVYENYDSIWVFNGSRDINIGRNIRSELRLLASVGASLNLIGYDEFDSTIRVAVVAAGQATTGVEHVYDLREGVWSKHKEVYTATGLYIISNQPVDVHGNVDGFVMKHDTSGINDDDGADIDGFVKTPFEDMGRPDRLKKFRTFILWLGAEGTYDLSIRFIKAYGITEGNEVLVPLASGSVWGTFVWGVDTWGAESLLRIEIPVPLADRIAPALQARMGTSKKDQRFRIRGYAWRAQIMRRAI